MYVYIKRYICIYGVYAEKGTRKHVCMYVLNDIHVYMVCMLREVRASVCALCISVLYDLL